MAEFSYKAKDSRGSEHVGTLTAPSRNAAATDLRERGWVVLSMVAEEPRKSAPQKELLAGIKRQRRPTGIDVELSLQQLALMLRSGMTLLAAIDSLTKQSTGSSISNVWENVAVEIQKGEELSVSMSNHRCFPEFVIGQIEIGEKTGNLDSVLARSIETLRDRRLARDDFVSATFYPLIVLLLSVCVTVYMIVFLIPKLEIYLQSLGKQMPAMTQSLMDGSTWLRSNFIGICVAILAIFVASAIVYTSREGRLIVDRFMLRMPMIGRLVRLKETFTFAQSLSTMLRSGITLIDGLGAAQKMVSNRFLAGIVTRAREKIIEGSNLSDAIDRTGGFTPMLVEMIKVGQQSGELDTVLDEVAELHRSQFKLYLKRLNAILTPTMTLLIGGVVGYVYIAFFIALFAAGG